MSNTFRQPTPAFAGSVPSPAGALTSAGHRERTLIVLFADHGELFLDDSTRNLSGLHGIQLDPTSVTTGAVVLLPTRGGDTTGRAAALAVSDDGAVSVRGAFPLQELGRVTAEFLDAGGRVGGTGRAGGPAAPWLSAFGRGDSLPARVVAVRSVGRPSLGGDVEAGRHTLSDADRADALKLWPDGRITFTPGAVERLHATADVGWTDGEWLLSYVPLARGGRRLECYHGGTLVRSWAVAAAPPHP